MSEDLVTAGAAEAVQRQVRVQLISQEEDIALPESILVPTGETHCRSKIINDDIKY